MMKSSAISFLAGLIFLSALCSGADELEIKVYALKSARPESLIELLDSMTAPQGKVIHDKATGRLIVRATADQHREIDEILTQLDVPVPNIRIDLTITDSTSGLDSEVGVTGSGGVIITPGGTSYDVRLDPKFKHETTTGSSSVRQQLLLQSGTEGRLFVGQDVHFREWVIDYGRRWGYIEQRHRIERVGASLRVSAGVLGDGASVAIDLVPEISVLVDGRDERISFTRAATQVIARDGVPTEIGGFGNNSELYNRYLAGIAHRGSTREMRMILVPSVEHVPGSGGTE